MMGLVLIGTKDTRRTEYFLKAAASLHVQAEFLSWDAWSEAALKGAVVKLDPPSYGSSDFLEMKELLDGYGKQLERMAQLADVTYLNSPEAIGRILDKVTCKQVLQQGGIPTTRMLGAYVTSLEELKQLMYEKKVFSVFVKPVYCSGAAGVTAFSWNPGKGKMSAYTSACVSEGKLVHTKKIRHLECEGDIRVLLEKVMQMGVIVERWEPKAEYNGRKYDIRVLYQFGRIEYMVARQSVQPITNLDLNNQALEIENLQLPGMIMEKIEQICKEAMSHFPGLQMAGIDVLLDKKTLKPRIIEMNGQGDLLYQDIFHENRIYKNQVMHMLGGKIKYY